jgi:hypothetical protein
MACMISFGAMFWQRPLEKVTFATSCWEKDWRSILLDPNYLSMRQIGHHKFPFAEKILMINNVESLEEVLAAAQKKVEEGVLTHVYVVQEWVQEILSFFKLKRSDFTSDLGSPSDWVYYNALGPLAALYFTRSEYFLYLTGDVTLPRKISWIDKAIRRMKKEEKYAVANLVWNEQYREVKRESYKKEKGFFVAKQGFSDQLFLVRTAEFRAPIYGEIRSDSSHFPRGDVWEKRVFSYLKNREKERLIYRHGSYLHKNF